MHGDRLAGVDEPGVPGALGRPSYRELLARCDGMHVALTQMGIGAGERVAVISPNALKLLVAPYAVTASGRVLVPINSRLAPEEAQFIIDDSGAALLLVDPILDAQFAAVRAPRRIVMDGERDADLFAPAPLGDWPVLDESAPATLNYTSGTTSRPKGVVLTHRSHWLNAVTVGWGLGLGPGDRYLHTLPIFHVSGWGLPLAAAALGVPNVMQRDVRGSDILSRVAGERITLLCGAAPVAAAIEGAANELGKAGSPVPGEGITRMVSGGAPTPPAVIRGFEAATGWEMIHAYGLTETGAVLTINRVLPEQDLSADARAERLAAAGSPLVGVRLGVDADGEILARTAKAMQGYWGEPAASRDAFRNGWFLTGDGGTYADGVLRVTDRKKDVIVTGGENVSSLQVEARLLEHPDVADAAIIGVPHERWGETPKALVVLRDGAVLDEAGLIAFCREGLAHFKCPTSIEQRDSLPRTATGKIQKYLLRRAFWD